MRGSSARERLIVREECPGVHAMLVQGSLQLLLAASRARNVRNNADCTLDGNLSCPTSGSLLSNPRNICHTLLDDCAAVCCTLHAKAT